MNEDKVDISKLLELLEQQAGRKLTQEEIKTFNLDYGHFKVDIDDGPADEINKSQSELVSQPAQQNEIGFGSMMDFASIFNTDTKPVDSDKEKSSDVKSEQSKLELPESQYEQEIPEEFSFIYNCPQGSPAVYGREGLNATDATDPRCVEVLNQTYTPSSELTEEEIEQQPMITIPSQDNFGYCLNPSPEDFNGISVMNSSIMADVNSFPTAEEIYRAKEIDNMSQPFSDQGFMQGDNMSNSPYQSAMNMSQQLQPFGQQTLGAPAMPFQPQQPGISPYNNVMQGPMQGPMSEQMLNNQVFNYQSGYSDPMMYTYEQPSYYGFNMNQQHCLEMIPPQRTSEDINGNKGINNISLDSVLASPAEQLMELQRDSVENTEHEIKIPVYERLVMDRKPMNVSLRRRRVRRGGKTTIS